MLDIPPPERLRQEYNEFKDSLGCIERPCFKNPKQHRAEEMAQLVKCFPHKDEGWR